MISGNGFLFDENSFIPKSIESFDSEHLSLFEKEHFDWPWSVEQWESINWAHHSLFLYHHKEELVGFSLYHNLPGDDTAHLLKIVINTSSRGVGHGKILLKKSLKHLKDNGFSNCNLEVKASNRPARELYERLGFNEQRVMKRFYQNGDNAVSYLIVL